MDRFNRLRFTSGAISGFLLFVAASVDAGELKPSDGAEFDMFGHSVSLSGSTGLIGAFGHDGTSGSDEGAAYIFRDLNVATGTETEVAKLVSTDISNDDSFAGSVSLSGNIGLIGAYGDDVGPNTDQGSAYIYHNLNTITGTVTQSAKLVASDGAAYDSFGGSVSLSGNMGLIGSSIDDIGSNYNQGSAYLFRNLDVATGTVVENVKLVASDGGAYQYFGKSVNLSGNMGIVTGLNHLSAYVYRDLDSATGTITEDAKLAAADGEVGDRFGNSISISDNAALLGAPGDSTGVRNGLGSAYLFRNLDAATGTMNQNVKLLASDGVVDDSFGESVSLSGNAALIGATGVGSNVGAAYLFLNLDVAVDSVSEDVKIVPSIGGGFFAKSVSLDGDLFLIGMEYDFDSGVNSGEAFSGNVSSVTTLDHGHASDIIEGISFVSRTTWIVGQNTDFNEVRLSQGDRADVSAGIYVGQNSGSDDNMLRISGTLTGGGVFVGSIDGNVGNVFQLDATANFSNISIFITPGNFLRIEGDYMETADLFDYLNSTAIFVWNESAWNFVDEENAATLISQNYSAGYTTVGVVPEPSIRLLLTIGLGMIVAARFARRNREVGVSVHNRIKGNVQIP